MVKLTKRSVELACPSATDKIIFDDDLAGFGLRISPSGRKTFIVQYRAGGRTRRISLGKFGVVTVDQARRRAKEALGAVAGGKDPAEQRNQGRSAPTFSSLADRFLNEHVRNHCKSRTMEEYSRLLRRRILPVFGNMRIAEIKRSDIAAFHNGMRDTPYQANRALAVLSKMFRLADIWGLRPEGTNPCLLVKKFPEKNKERYLSKQELAHLLGVLERRLENGQETKSVTSAFLLLIYTGCRLSEARQLKWQYVKRGAIELPDTKTGARRIPISEDAERVIKSMPRALHSDYVFWANGPQGFITDFQKPWRRIRKEAGLDDVRIHDLRHTYASLAVQEGIPLQLVGKLLGHTQLQTTMRYAHLAEDDVRAAANVVGGIVTNASASKEDACKGLPPGAIAS